MSEQSNEYRIDLAIDHGEDYYEIHTVDGEVYIVLWSRGTFTVKVKLTARDAQRFSEALGNVAVVAEDKTNAIRHRTILSLSSQESPNT